MASPDHDAAGAPTLQKQTSRSRNPTLFLSNLPQNIAPVQIDDVFHQHGLETASVELLKKGHGSHLKTCGLGVVTLKDPQANLDACIEALDGQPLWGRPIIVRKDKFVEDNAAYEHVPAVHVQQVPAQLAPARAPLGKAR